MIERSLVLMKPDAVQRGIVGDILHRFERAGLKVVGAKLTQATRDLAQQHYNKDTAWKKKVGEFNIRDCEELGLDVKELFGTEDPLKIGDQVNSWLFDYFTAGPVFAFVFEGPHAVKKIRTLVGATFPDTAPPGTIRGDYGLDSGLSALKRKRSTFNMIHASGTVDEAIEEVKLWFSDEELLEYKRIHEELYSY